MPETAGPRSAAATMPDLYAILCGKAFIARRDWNAVQANGRRESILLTCQEVRLKCAPPTSTG